LKTISYPSFLPVFDMVREWIVETVYFVCKGANCKMSQKGVNLGQASQNKFIVACWGWGVEATIKFYGASIKFYGIFDMFCVLDPWNLRRDVWSCSG